jgi:hypothetical protein
MMKRKSMLLLAIVIGLLLTFTAVGAARMPVIQPGDLAAMAQPAANERAASRPLLATDAVSTTFSYQGLLRDGGSATDGAYDFEFLLFDDPLAGSQVGAMLTLEDVTVEGGLFTVHLNFGDVFDGRALWLEIRVRPGSETTGYTILAPRQALSAAPYAHSLRPGATISGAIASTAGEGVLNLNNSDGNALNVGGASDIGVNIETATTGLWVEVANDALVVESARFNGLEVLSAGGDGVIVSDAGGNGLQVTSAGGDAILVDSTGGNGLYIGSAQGFGVYVNQAAENGVYASSTSADSYGGLFMNSAPGGSALYAAAGDNVSADMVLAGSSGILSSDPSTNSSSLNFMSNDDAEFRLDADNDEAGFFTVYNGAGGLVFVVDESGNVTGAGVKSAMVQTEEYGQVKLYAVESPENWFEDFGSASLVTGEATVTIAPDFAATVNLGQDYHVFLTPLGDCALYVAEKTPATFEVRAQDGSTCSVAFDYRIVAKRLGYEDVRMESLDFAQFGEEE